MSFLTIRGQVNDFCKLTPNGLAIFKFSLLLPIYQMD